MFLNLYLFSTLKMFRFTLRRFLIPESLKSFKFPNRNSFTHQTTIELPLFPPGFPLSEEKIEKFRVGRGRLPLSMEKRGYYGLFQ